MADTLATILNYSLTHSKVSGGTNCDSSNIPLAVSFSSDTFYVGESQSVAISLGDNLNPATGVYGAAFSILYDNVNIDTSSMRVRFDTAFGALNGLLTFRKFFHSQGRVDIAVSGTNRVNRTVNGVIANLDFVMEENLVQKGPITETVITTFLAFDLVDERVIAQSETEVLVCAQSDSVLGAQVIIGIEEPKMETIKMYPNPAQDLFTIENHRGQIASIQLINLLGDVVVEMNDLPVVDVQVNIADLSAGMYIVKANSKSGEVVSARIHKQGAE